MQKKIFNVKKEDAGKRVDVFLAEQTGFTRSHVKKICDEGNLFVNDKVVKSNKTTESFRFGTNRRSA